MRCGTAIDYNNYVREILQRTCSIIQFKLVVLGRLLRLMKQSSQDINTAKKGSYMSSGLTEDWVGRPDRLFCMQCHVGIVTHWKNAYTTLFFQESQFSVICGGCALTFLKQTITVLSIEQWALWSEAINGTAAIAVLW